MRWYPVIHRATIVTRVAPVLGPLGDLTVHVVGCAAVLLLHGGLSRRTRSIIVAALLASIGVAFVSADAGLALASAASLILFVAAGFVDDGFSLRELCSVLVCVEAFAAVCWFLEWLGVSVDNPVLVLEAELWWVLAVLGPIALLLAAYYPLVKLYVRKLEEELGLRFKVKLLFSEGSLPLAGYCGLALGAALAAALMLMPYAPWVNPMQAPVSVDARYYAMWLNKMLREGVGYAFAARPERGLYLLMLYSFVALGAPVDAVAKYHNVVLAVLLVVASYFLALRLTGSRRIAGLAAVVSAVSPQLVAFMYGGFQACMFATALAYIALGLAFKPQGKHDVLVSSMLLALLVVIHPWALCVVAMMVVALALAKREWSVLKPLLAPAALAVIAIALKPELAVIVLKPVLKSLGVSPQAMASAFTVLLWGALSMPLAYILSAAAVRETEELWALAAPATIIPFFKSYHIVARITIEIPVAVLVAVVLDKMGRTEQAACLLALAAFALRMAVNAI